MTFMIEVTGDAFSFMVDEWDERDSFTRAELGGAPDWADYVDADGELLSENEMSDGYVELLNDMYDMVDVCGYSFEAGAVLREMDPIAFRCGMLDWISGRIQGGDLRRIEG